jgi:hypothetical protein
MTATTAPTPGSARPARTNWPVALVLVGAGVAGALQIGKAVAAPPAVRADLELSLVTAGWVLSLVNLAGALTGLLIGAVADRVGHRRAELARLVVAAVCRVRPPPPHPAHRRCWPPGSERASVSCWRHRPSPDC